MDPFPPDATASPSSHPNDLRASLHATWKEIEAVKERIKQTMEVVERANASLKDLRDLETELVETAKDKAWLLSPFKKLSTDNISDIVGHVTSPPIRLGQLGYCSIWSMTHVCSSWRQMILSLPHLWSSFSIDDKTPLKMVLAVLKRSGSHPLSLSSRTGPEITSLLVDQSERWKDAKIDISVGPDVFLRLYKRLPLLESLKLSFFDMPGKQGWTNSQEHKRIFQYAPKLSKLDLSHSPTVLPVAFRFPFKQLVQYRSGWDTESRRIASRQLDGLSRFDKLSSLSLYPVGDHPGLTFNDDGPNRVPSIELATVKHLRVVYNLGLLAMIITPSLTELELLAVEINDNSLDVLPGFLSSISRSRLIMFNLGLLSSGNDSECIEDLLADPGLEHVQTLIVNQGVQQPDQWGNHLSSLWIQSFLSRSTYVPDRHFPGSNPQLLLPNLRDISLEYEFTSEETVFDVFKDFVASRTDMIDKLGRDRNGTLEFEDGNLLVPAQLEAIRFKYSDIFEPVTMENFHQFKAGLVELHPRWDPS